MKMPEEPASPVYDDQTIADMFSFDEDEKPSHSLSDNIDEIFEDSLEYTAELSGKGDPTRTIALPVRSAYMLSFYDF